MFSLTLTLITTLMVIYFNLFIIYMYFFFKFSEDNSYLFNNLKKRTKRISLECFGIVVKKIC